MNTNQLLSLVDYLAHKAGCAYVSDLRYLDACGRLRLARVVEKLQPHAVPLCEWNDALAYLANTPTEQTQEAARERLVTLLKQPPECINKK